MKSWVRDLTLEAIESGLVTTLDDQAGVRSGPPLFAAAKDALGMRSAQGIHEWQIEQRARAMVAAVLAARLLHVRQGRLHAVGLERDNGQVSLQALAALHRGHNGTLGHGFEIAVSDAINDGVVDVRRPLQQALRHLGLDEPIVGCAHLGLENLPQSQRLAVLETVIGAMPTGVKFNTGQLGLRLPPEQALEPLLTASATGGEDPHDSKLHKADALLWTERDVIAVSYKSNPRQIVWSGWRDVPIWISGPGLPPKTLPERYYPVAPVFVGNLWFDHLRRAHALVDRVLSDLDLGRPRMNEADAGSPEWQGRQRWFWIYLRLYDELRSAKNDHIGQIIGRVRSNTAPEALAELAEPKATTLHVDVGNDDTLVASIDADVSANGLFIASRHLLAPPSRRDPIGRSLRDSLVKPWSTPQSLTRVRPQWNVE